MFFDLIQLIGIDDTKPCHTQHVLLFLSIFYLRLSSKFDIHLSKALIQIYPTTI